MRVDIRQYDLPGATILPEKNFYVIAVPGLAEKRPSVLRGDAVRVKLSGDNNGDMYPFFFGSKILMNCFRQLIDSMDMRIL